MPRVKIGPALPDRATLDVEIARLRDLDVTELRSHWQAVFGRPAPPHLARHLLFRTLAYRLQADRWGDLEGETHLCKRQGQRTNSVCRDYYQTPFPHIGRSICIRQLGTVKRRRSQSNLPKILVRLFPRPSQVLAKFPVRDQKQNS